jgi:hypothetical protein
MKEKNDKKTDNAKTEMKSENLRIFQQRKSQIKKIFFWDSKEASGNE